MSPGFEYRWRRILYPFSELILFLTSALKLGTHSVEKMVWGGVKRAAYFIPNLNDYKQNYLYIFVRFFELVNVNSLSARIYEEQTVAQQDIPARLPARYREGIGKPFIMGFEFNQ